MLHDETRKLLIEAWNKTHNAKEIAECFSVNTSTVYRLEKQMRETGSVKTMTSQRGRKHALIVMKQSARQLLNSGILTRKNLFMPQSRSVPDVREKRRNWKKHMSEKDINHLFFLDESGVNINMTRHYARAWKNRRAVDKTPLNTPCNTTVLSSIRLIVDCAYTVYRG